jgi:large repetitive protein
MNRFIIWSCVVVVACGDNKDVLPPELQNRTLTTAEDTPFTVTVPVIAADASELSLSIVTPPSHGTLAGSGPRWTYTPAANYVGDDTIVVLAEDPHGSDTATVTIHVTAVNDAPAPVADSFAAGFETALVITHAMLLANDGDIDSSTLTVSSVTAGSHGTPAISGGNVVFTPEIGYNGAATFTYTISDGALSAQATVSVSIGPDAAPVAVDDSATTDEDSPAVIADATLVANDTDVENHTLTISAVGNASHGTVSHAGNQVTFVPDANYHGPAGFEYTVSDGYKTDVASVVVTVGSVNDAPVSVTDPASTDEDLPLTLAAASLVTNDSDVDGDSLSVTAVTAGATTHGTVALVAGTVTYSPDANFNGAATFAYTASDGNGGTTTGTVAITVGAINDAPVAVADTGTTNEDAPLTVTAAQLATNDTDVDGDGLTVTGVAATASTHGTVGLASGSITYTPAAHFNGGADFTYTVSDGNGGTATGTMAITVSSINDAPSVAASAGAVAYVENAAAETVDPGIAIADADSASLIGATIAITGNCTPAEDVLALASPPAGIAVTGYSAATCTLTLAGPASLADYQVALRAVSYANTSDDPASAARTVTFTIDDGEPGDHTGADSRGVTVSPVDDAPVAVDDSASLAEDAAATAIAVLGNDTDPDAGSKSIDSVTQPAFGTVVITGGGTGLTYAPSANFCNASAPAVGPPPLDTFSYTLSPGGSTATVSVTVTCVDDAPVAVDDSATVAEGSGANAINVLANDTDLDGGANLVASVTQPSNGSVAIAGDGLSLTYTPAAGYCNEVPNLALDTFTYTLTPGGSSSTVSVTVTCACGNNRSTDFVVGSN